MWLYYLKKLSISRVKSDMQKLEKSGQNSQDCIFNAMKSSCKIIVHAPNVNMSSKAGDDRSTCAS